MPSMYVMIIIAVILLLLFIAAAAMYNSLVRAKQRVEEAFATMDVYMKKRTDLIPNLVECVKGYKEYEKTTLEDIVKARNSIQSAGTLEDRAESEGKLSGLLRQFFALSEAYPDLKANENFMNLQNQLEATEQDIANARVYYNAVVRDYNTGIMSFPKNIVAGLFHFSKETMFNISEAERQPVKVEF